MTLENQFGLYHHQTLCANERTLITKILIIFFSLLSKLRQLANKFWTIFTVEAFSKE
jgi:hypothetical protein